MEKELTVPEVAEAADVSEATIHRWKNNPDNAGRLPQPIRRPGKAATWAQSAIDEWLRTFDAVRQVEKSMEAFGGCEALDPLLAKIARYGHRLLSDTSIPLGLRKSLADMLSTIRWDRADGTKLSSADRTRACSALIQLMGLYAESQS